MAMLAGLAFLVVIFAAVGFNSYLIGLALYNLFCGDDSDE